MPFAVMSATVRQVRVVLVDAGQFVVAGRVAGTTYFYYGFHRRPRVRLVSAEARAQKEQCHGTGGRMGRAGCAVERAYRACSRSRFFFFPFLLVLPASMRCGFFVRVGESVFA
jgi:ribosomal protein L2